MAMLMSEGQGIRRMPRRHRPSTSTPLRCRKRCKTSPTPFPSSQESGRTQDLASSRRCRSLEATWISTRSTTTSNSSCGFGAWRA